MMTGNPPPSWQGKPPTRDKTARIMYAVALAAAIVALIYYCSACTGENRVSSEDYGDILMQQEQCAQNYLTRDHVMVAMHLEPVAIDAPFSVVVPGGVHLVSQDSITKRLNGGPGFEISVIGKAPDVGTVYVTNSSDHKRDVVAHALSHQLPRVYPQLRNPPMADSVNYDDHSGRFFASCVSYCPGCPGHPNA